MTTPTPSTPSYETALTFRATEEALKSWREQEQAVIALHQALIAPAEDEGTDAWFERNRALLRQIERQQNIAAAAYVRLRLGLRP